MKSFRFPRFAILLMIVTFLTILAAIGLAAEMSRTIQAQYAVNLSASWWTLMPGGFLKVFMIFWGIGALGFAVVFLFQRAGVHRFSNIDPWHEPRK